MGSKIFLNITENSLGAITMQESRRAPRARAGAFVVALAGGAIAAAAITPGTAEAAPCPIYTPVVGAEFSSGFHYRGRRFHPGVDLRAPIGTPVQAPVGGRVIYTGRWYAYGLIVDIQHNDGSMSRYAHLSRIDVQTGAAVRPGQQIGSVGRTGRTTGSHLHVELRRNGRPEDPWPWLTRTACIDNQQLAEAPR